VDHAPGLFRDRPVGPLGESVLLRCLRYGELVCNTVVAQVLSELRRCIFPAIVQPQLLDLEAGCVLSPSLVRLKASKDVTLELYQEDHRESRRVVDKGPHTSV